MSTRATAAFLWTLAVARPASAQGAAPRPMTVTFDGCAPRVERTVVGDLSRPERSRVRLVARDGAEVWRAQVRCRGAVVEVHVRSPRGVASQAALRGVDPHDLREVLLAPVERGPDDPPQPPAAVTVAVAERVAPPRPAPRARRWALTLGATGRLNSGGQLWLGGVALGAVYRSASGLGLRAELSGEFGGARDPQVGGVSLTLGGACALVEWRWDLAWGGPSLGVGVRGGFAHVQEDGPRSRVGVMPWGGAVVRAGTTVSVRGPWRVYVGVEGGAAATPAAVAADDRLIASVGPLWMGATVAGEMAP